MSKQNEIQYEKLLAKSVPKIKKIIFRLIEEIEESMHYFIQKLKALENNGYTKCDNEHDMFKGMCLFKILANIFDDYSFIISYCELIRAYSNISNEFDSY